MINLTIDGKAIAVDDGTTVLDAARMVGIDIPTLCHFETSPPAPSPIREGEPEKEKSNLRFPVLSVP